MLGNLLESYPVFQRFLLRFLLPAVVGGFVGFFALALAMQNEPSIPLPLLALFSPGLKVAELIAPVRHDTFRTLGPTFSSFLRVALAVNAAFYFAVLALPIHLLGRRFSRKITH